MGSRIFTKSCLPMPAGSRKHTRQSVSPEERETEGLPANSVNPPDRSFAAGLPIGSRASSLGEASKLLDRGLDALDRRIPHVRRRDAYCSGCTCRNWLRREALAPRSRCCNRRRKNRDRGGGRSPRISAASGEPTRHRSPRTWRVLPPRCCSARLSVCSSHSLPTTKWRRKIRLSDDDDPRFPVAAVGAYEIAEFGDVKRTAIALQRRNFMRSRSGPAIRTMSKPPCEPATRTSTG